MPILGKHIPELVQFLLQCGSNRNFEPELRVLALNALNWTVQYKKSKVQSQNLAAAILEGLMPITTEEEPEDVDDDAPSRVSIILMHLLGYYADRIIFSLPSASSTGLPPTCHPLKSSLPSAPSSLSTLTLVIPAIVVALFSPLVSVLRVAANI